MSGRPDTPREPGGGAPIFVIGAPRSGVGILAWSLGQHPGIATVLDSGWIGRLSEELGAAYRHDTRNPERSQMAIAGTTASSFLAGFGPPVEMALGLGSPVPEPASTRWVEGSAANSLHVYGLKGIFPGARFIHVVRSVDSVVRSLVETATPDGSYYTEASACETWLRCSRACVRAERALGSESVLRIRHPDLVTHPEETLRRCLAFLQEPFHPGCLRPLRGLRPDSEPGPGGSHPEPERSRSHAEARALSRVLLEPAARMRDPEPHAMAELALEFGTHGATDPHGIGAPSTAARIGEMARRAIPRGAIVLVVSRGDEDLVRIPGRRGWHFPRTGDGLYAGHHPADSADAVAHLEALREAGADFLLIPCTAFWWLEHYHGFRSHLEGNYRLTMYAEDTCLIFALRRTPARDGVSLQKPEEDTR